jgi:hypothetical protein
MIFQLFAKLIQHWIHESDPEKLRSWVYLTQAGLGVLVGLLWLWLRDRETPSGFRVREADLKKEIKNAIGKKPAHALPGDPLAEARYQKKAEPLRLAGISLTGAPHEILGVHAHASEREIRSAYRELMKRYHPDRVGRPGTREWTDAQKIAEAINQAKDQMLSAIKVK